MFGDLVGDGDADARLWGTARRGPQKRSGDGHAVWDRRHQVPRDARIQWRETRKPKPDTLDQTPTPLTRHLVPGTLILIRNPHTLNYKALNPEP